MQLSLRIHLEITMKSCRLYHVVPPFSYQQFRWHSEILVGQVCMLAAETQFCQKQVLVFWCRFLEAAVFYMFFPGAKNPSVLKEFNGIASKSTHSLPGV